MNIAAPTSALWLAEQYATHKKSPSASADQIIKAGQQGVSPEEYLMSEMAKQAFQLAQGWAADPMMTQKVLNMVSPGEQAITADHFTGAGDMAGGGAQPTMPNNQMTESFPTSMPQVDITQLPQYQAYQQDIQQLNGLQRPQAPQMVTPQAPSAAQSIVAGLGALAGGPYGGGLEASTQPFTANAKQADRENAMAMQKFQQDQATYEDRVRQLMQMANLHQDDAKLIAGMEMRRREQELEAKQKEFMYRQAENKQNDMNARNDRADYAKVVKQAQDQANFIINKYGYLTDQDKADLLSLVDSEAMRYGQTPKDLILPGGETLSVKKQKASEDQFKQKMSRLQQVDAQRFMKMKADIEKIQADIRNAVDSNNQRAYATSVAAYNAITNRFKAQQNASKNDKGKQKQGVEIAKLEAEVAGIQGSLKSAKAAGDDAKVREYSDRLAAKQAYLETLKEYFGKLPELSTGPSMQEVQADAELKIGQAPQQQTQPNVNGSIGKAQALEQKYSRKIGGIRFKN